MTCWSSWSRLSVALVAAGLGAACAGAPVESQESTVSLDGVIDFHTHTGPDSRPRSVNDIEAARGAKAAGMRGVVFKNHFTMTADRAALAMDQVDGIEVFGGVVLNRAVGGINAEAVRQLVEFSGGRGKVVWLPTFDAEHYITRDGADAPFVSVVENGRPVDGLDEVFSLIATHDLVLAMGHSSPEEVLLLLPEAARLGVSNIVITHVLGQNPSRVQMQQMAEAGAVMELDWYAVYQQRRTVDEYVSLVTEIGAEHFLISSDLGQAGSPSHADGLRAFIGALRAGGLSDDEIDMMARTNPARLLGLSPVTN